MSEVGVEIVKTEETKESGIRYLNINVSNSQVERDPDIVRLCSDVGILEYAKPCDDAVSQQTVVDAIDRWVRKKHILIELSGIEITSLFDSVSGLPSVIPQPKTGHWIEDAGTYYKAIHERGCEPDENTPIFLDDIACSKCLAKFSVIDNETQRFKCCPNCGAKMIDPQERERDEE